MREHNLELPRLLNLSDGVFAVAMTFLAFMIHLPGQGKGTTGAVLLHQLMALRPQLMALGVSYFMVARFWVVHHYIFGLIRCEDSVVLALNFILLFWVVLLPFSADLLGTFQLQALTVGIYGFNMAAIGATQFLIWRHATAGRGLIKRSVSRCQVRFYLVRTIVYSVVFLLSIPISFFDAPLAMLSWLIAPAIILVDRLIKRNASR